MDNFIDKLAEKLNMQGAVNANTSQAGGQNLSMRNQAVQPMPMQSMNMQDPLSEQSIAFAGGMQRNMGQPLQQPLPPNFTNFTETATAEIEKEILQLGQYVKENNSRQLEMIAELVRQNNVNQQELIQNTIVTALRQSANQQNTQLQQAIISAMEETAMSNHSQAPALDISALQELLSEYKADVRQQFTQLEEHVHKENVKCYRNVQAVVIEQVKTQIPDGIEKNISLVKVMTGVSIILAAANVVVTILNLLGIL